MICECEINCTHYYFDGNSMLLYKDNPPVNHIQKNIEKSEILSKAMINVSNICGGGCLYCYEYGGDFGKDKTVMSLHAADTCLEYLISHYGRVKNIEFFGGEPTLNFPVIQYIVMQSLEAGLCSKFSIVTNAVCITDDMLDFFSRYKFHIIVSLDGPEEIHDFLRRNCPHKKVIDSIQKIRSSPLSDNIEVNCTYTHFHQRKIQYKDLCSYFENLGLNFTISNVKTEDATLKIQRETILDEKAFIRNSYLRLKSNSKNRTVSRYVKNILNALVFRKYHLNFCTELCHFGTVVFDVHAQIYPCEALMYYDGIAPAYIDSCNSKCNPICNKCWAQGLCTLCVADYIKSNVSYPFENTPCYKEELYRYALEVLLEYYETDATAFQSILEGFVLQR